MARHPHAMKILFTCDHTYPLPRTGVGRNPKAMPSASAQRIHDWLGKGLAELGHEVVYVLEEEPAGEPLPGVRIVRAPEPDADIVHTYAMRPPHWEASWRGPSVATCHLDPRTRGIHVIPDNWIFASGTMARTFGSTRYVINGIDPSEYRFSAVRGDYLLFLSAMDRYLAKGLDLALAVAREAGMPLIVAGTAGTTEIIDAVAALCASYGAEYVGDVQGGEKAALLAGARALIFPSRLNEVCPVTVGEALVSGTPVITSESGGLSEIVKSEMGIICRTFEEYVAAVAEIDRFDRAVCRASALRDFHYLRMARDYVAEYERELGALPVGALRARREDMASSSSATVTS
jgi:glycosyltransferase involved in cell wall biosynthesis